MYAIYTIFNACTYRNVFLRKREKKTLICEKMMVDAFVSIEYTLLVPVLFVLYAFLICIGIYQYNQCILQTNMYLLGIESTRFTDETHQNQIDKLQEIEKNLYYDKYLGVFDIETIYSIKRNQLELTGLGKINNILSKFGVGEQEWKIRASCKVDMINPVETVKLCKTAYRIYQKVWWEEQQDNE